MEELIGKIRNWFNATSHDMGKEEFDALIGIIETSLTENQTPRAEVTLDCLVMPRALTAENGAKGLLSGEFHETVGFTCPDCDGDFDLETDQCGTCEDTGECAQEVPISWSNIKDIYAMAVKHLGALTQN